MPQVRGQAVAMALLALTAGLGSLAEVTQGTPEEPHAPITIDGDQALHSNACACVRNPGASGTASDKYVISDWRITSSDVGIDIRNIENTHFVIRDSTVEADTAIRLVNTGDRATIVETTLNFEDEAIILKDSSTRVADNDLIGHKSSWWGTPTAITIDGGSPRIDGNYISKAKVGILAKSSSPVIEDNEIGNVNTAIKLTASTEARVVENTIRLTENVGVLVKDSAHARLISNEIREGHGGVVSKDAKLFMQDNLVMNQRADAVRFENTILTMFRNDISDNWRGAFGSKDSDVLIRNNTFRDNGDGTGPNNNEGLRLEGSEGRVVANDIHGNDIGIRLVDSKITLEDNQLTDNRWGMSIPYDSKGSIPMMSGNFVNGINVDGTVHASHQRIFYEEVNITIEDKNVDSGHDDGHFGTLFKQGAIVVYDSQDVTIRNSTFTYNDVAVHIQDSSFVRVRDNTFASNAKAVISIDSRTFIKDNVCDIEIDPPQTICFEVEGGFATVRNNVALNVAVGVFFHASATGEIVDNSVRSTVEAGIHLEGSVKQNTRHVQVVDNNIEANAVGMVLFGFRGEISGNTIADSTWAAAELDARSNATWINNHIVANAEGVVDTDTCQDNYRTPCSTGVFIDNTFESNGEVAVRLENGASFDGDVFVDNEIGADIHGQARMKNVEVTHNEKIGVRVHGQLALQDSNLSANGKHGVRVVGGFSADNVTASFNGDTGIKVTGQASMQTITARNNSEDGAELLGSASIRDGNFSGNADTGLRLGGTLFIVEDCEASWNINGVVMVEGDIEISIQPPVPQPPPIGIPDIPDLPDLEDDEESDPLWMHECDLVANEDFALRANIEAHVNATQNFWGKTGPTIDTPLLSGDNVVSPNAVVSPYYETREHETHCLIPDAETSAHSPDGGCIEA